MRESRWRAQLARYAVDGFEGGETIVDVGAGTGRQSVELADAYEYARVVAVDGDPQALAIAKRNLAGEPIDWRLGMADDLPLETGSADAVVMTLLLHHLDVDGKRAALREAARVLRPGARLCIADWGPPLGRAATIGFRVLRAVDGAAGLDDNATGALPEFIAAAGFAEPRVGLRVPTVWGTLELWTATRPAW
jgi:ubiquinone/menaquinone biosynthesis C-methylase UbiE